MSATAYTLLWCAAVALAVAAYYYTKVRRP